jgi:hypothetical protein
VPQPLRYGVPQFIANILIICKIREMDIFIRLISKL